MEKGKEVSWNLTLTLIVLAITVVGGAWLILKSRNMHIWIIPYIVGWLQSFFMRHDVKVKVYFCLADHYEPYWNKADRIKALSRVKKWVEGYEKLAANHRDSMGKTPQHSFFYPYEEYDEDIMNQLSELCKRGSGEIQIHLHHDNDNSANLQSTLEEFKSTLHHKHDCLHNNLDKDLVEYCFIHGNWALDNSRPDGKWCGVENELQVLVDSGCVCDMTMPSAPSDTQTRKINSIYFAKGRAGRSKSHNVGRDARVGDWARHDELLLIQGPLRLNWQKRKLGLLPRIDSGEISADAPITPERIGLWLGARVGVKGDNSQIFIKVHTHGAEDTTSDYLLGDGLNELWTELEKQVRDRENYELYYVTAWQMYKKVEEICCTSAD